MSNCTVQERHDGFGAQFQTVIYGIIITETTGNKYVHSPIKTMEHNYNNDPTFLKKIDELMNISSNYTCIQDIETNEPLKIWTISELIGTFERNMNLFLNSDSFIRVKECFWKNKNKNFFNNNKYNVAVHIRRPNKHDNRIEGANEALEYYFNIIRKIRNQNINKQVMFHIYSQNEQSDYDHLDIQEDICFHLNESLSDTFIGLVAADALVTSGSSLSYTAALLSEGEIYYKPFWHPPRENWIVC
jgi:hypothetical protein